MIQQMLAVWSLSSSAFSKSSLNIWDFMVHVLLKLGLENFEHYFASVWDGCSCVVIWTFFGIVFLWDWYESRPFQSSGHCSFFQICWYIECSTFTASSFRTWNSSAEIPSPLLALFIVMLLKPNLTSHSRTSGSRFVITPWWLSGSWRSFLDSSVYSCYSFLISSASVRFIPFVLFCAHLCMKCSLQFSSVAQSCPTLCDPLVSLIFLKRSLVFPILLFSCISLHWSLRKSPG